MARGRLETTVTRRKKGDPAAERVAAAIMEEFSPKTAEEAQEALRSVFGPMIETMLKAELEAHLGHPDNDKGPKDGPNRRNGYTRKVVRTSAGEVPIDVPRDRDATFEPAVVPKGERDLTGIESRVMSMYARGMSQRDIAATVREIYGFSMSAETVSAITVFVASKMLTKRHVAFEHFGRHVLHCFFALPSIKAASMRWLAPLNSTSLPWWTILSIMADASLSSPRTVPHFENSMFVVNIMLRLS